MVAANETGTDAAAPPRGAGRPPSGADFDAVVFAGGGCRCFWQAGFWTVAAPALGLAPRWVAAVSAGSAFACAALTDSIERVRKDFQRRVEANPRNAYWRNALRGEPVFPQERIYRATILDNTDEDLLARLHAGPELRILVARGPARLGPWAGLGAAAVAHGVERALPSRIHAVWGRRLGFRPEGVPVRRCRTPEALADLILHSSCTPPFTAAHRRDGRLVLDGGLLDNAPVGLVPEARRVLVLLTRAYPPAALPRVPGRTYVHPSVPTPITSWDYTDPAAVQETFDLGRRDGERFARGRSTGDGERFARGRSTGDGERFARDVQGA